MRVAEALLADEIERGELWLHDDGSNAYRVSAHDRGLIVAALRTVSIAKEELIRETELTRKNFSVQ